MSVPTTIPHPSPETLVAAVRAAFKLNVSSICIDYWEPSHTGLAMIGRRPDGSSLLIKSDGEEYTTKIEKLMKTKDDLIAVTQNSLYIISGKIGQKKVTSLPDDEDE